VVSSLFPSTPVTGENLGASTFEHLGISYGFLDRGENTEFGGDWYRKIRVQNIDYSTPVS
jgi:hypothetical protein